MKTEINCMYWDNCADLLDLHKKVTKFFNLPVVYEKTTKPHGQWMTEILENSKSDIIGFFDIDCIPLNKDIVYYALSYINSTKTFFGTAQCSYHIPPSSHIYAAPSFFFIYKKTWEILGKPSFSETNRSDVGEELSYIAENKNIFYNVLYPTSFEQEPINGAWRMGNYGYYGIGTVFANSVYHLFQSRLGDNIELFENKCKQVLEGIFTNKNTISSTSFYSGRIAGDSPENWYRILNKK